MMDDSTTLGQRVRKFREQQGYSLSELARRAGISRSYLYQLETDASSPTQEKLELLARALNVALQDLLGIAIPSPSRPKELLEFAERYRLSEEDIRMLSGIQYRGKRPSSVREWRILYDVIRGTLADEEA